MFLQALSAQPPPHLGHCPSVLVARLVPPPSCVATCRMGRLMGPFPSLAQVKGAPMGRAVLRRSGWAVAYCGLHACPGGRRGFDRRFISRKVAFLFEGSSAHRRSRLHGRQSRIELGLSTVSSVTRERCNPHAPCSAAIATPCCRQCQILQHLAQWALQRIMMLRSCRELADGLLAAWRRSIAGFPATGEGEGGGHAGKTPGERYSTP